MVGLQELIHKFEVGEGARYIKMGAALLVLLTLTMVYHLRETKNFSTPEAMDGAQLARNLAEGHGFTTQCIRPLSLYLVQQHNLASRQKTNDLMMLRSAHPDLANPPVYPLFLAGVMKVAPFNYDIPKGPFSRYQPEIVIDIANQLLFFLAAFLLYRLAKRMFDAGVAILSVTVFLGADLYWQFAVSGLSTMLVIVILLALAWVLVVNDQASLATEPEKQRGNGWHLGMAALAGFLVALACLTRYAAGWLIIPVVLYFAIYAAGRRLSMIVGALTAFIIVISPWLVRNYELSGHPFGTAEFAAISGTHLFEGNHLERSISPNFEKITFDEYIKKFIVNTIDIFQNELPRLGGSWVAAFFLVGLMIPFNNPVLNRFRVFLAASLIVLVAAQAIGRTHLSNAPGGVHTENLLALAAPLVFIFGVALYYMLLDQLVLPFPEARYFITTIFCAAACGPFILTVLPPRTPPVAFPPYWPPIIRQSSTWIKEQDLMMSDMPWAVAWYGNRQCVWTVLHVEPDFYTINDYEKPIRGLHLSQLTTDARFYTDIVSGQEKTWEWFLYQSRGRTNVSPGFPLRKEVGEIFRSQGDLYLFDELVWQQNNK